MDDKNKEKEAELDVNRSLRQSPPPVTAGKIPSGAVISPPESTNNSSDDEDGSRESIEQLHRAVSGIKQQRDGSPDGNEGSKRTTQALHILTSDLNMSSPDAPQSNDDAASRPPLSKEARKISHSRSSSAQTSLEIPQTQSGSPSPYRTSDSSETDEESPRIKPAMVRKKSGELVRPALRSKRRPSSMPGTPTFGGKAVHFDQHLEHVRTFLKVDKPLAVSAGSSPAEGYENEIEFPFAYDAGFPPTVGGPFEWEISLANFPSEATQQERKLAPVRVERVFLSSDNKFLIGVVAVSNLSFHKQVVARYTLDYWKTTSEITAEYSNDIRKNHDDGCDRFNFSLKLADQANLESRTMIFCVRYIVAGKEFWDNNNSINYQVTFKKKSKNQGRGTQGVGGPSSGLPRSRPSPPLSTGRPQSMPVTFDDFASGLDNNFGSFIQSPTNMIGESPIKLRQKSAQLNDQVIPDAPAKKVTPAGQAFGHRYDFGTAINAAIRNKMSDRIQEEMPKAKPSFVEPTSQTAPPKVEFAPQGEGVTSPEPTAQRHSVQKTPPMIEGAKSAPIDLTSDKPSHKSLSYQELVDKYCFVRSLNVPK